MNVLLQSILSPLSPRQGTIATSSRDRLGIDDYTPALPQRRIRLQGGDVIRIEREDEIAAFVVTKGLLWLTATPAISGDVILQEGDSLEASPIHSLPWVVEALEDSVILVRESFSRTD